MAPTREIVKRRIGPQGEDTECDQDDVRWIDIKETKKIRYERGKGPAYQKTRYTMRVLEGEADRLYIDPALRVKNPNNEDQFIDYQRGVLKKVRIECGKGPHYQKTVLTFDNSEENNNRTVRIQKVQNENTGDYIEVERIEKFQVRAGKGPAYQVKRVTLLNSEENIEQMDGPCKIEAEG